MTHFNDSATIWRFDTDGTDHFSTDGLVAKYRRREPTDFGEMLEAAVATYETSFGRCFCVPFIRMLGPTGLRHFDTHGAGGGVDNRALWHRDLPRLIDETGARTVVVASQGILSHTVAPAASVVAQTALPTGILSIDCLDVDGRHEQAMCLVSVGAQAATRIVGWRNASIKPETLRDADNDSARALARLRANRER